MLAVTPPVAAALTKRCDSWHLRLDKMSFERGGNPEAKTRALQDVARTYASQAGSLEVVAKARLHWLKALQLQLGDRFRTVALTLESRLLLHLGRANVLENVGLYAERTTGLPIIPGTALKGVVSTWACWEANQKSDGSFNEGAAFLSQRRDLARRILGDDDPGGSAHAGDIIFLGGFPTTPPKLGLDIVNPHHRSDGSVETRLTPSAFLCVEPGTLWRVAFFVRPGVLDAAALVTQTQAWIEEALTQSGIGAKTAAGYGRFRRPTEADVAARKQQEAQAAAAQATAARQAEAEAAKAKQHAAAHAVLQSDYSNDLSFKNRVLDKLNPGQLDQLRLEVELLKKPGNASRREQLQAALASKDGKDIRKRLRGKDWFPQDWLPAQ